MLTNRALFAPENPTLADFFCGKSYPWELLDSIQSFVERLGRSLPEDEYNHPCEGVWIAKDALVAQTAYIGKPCVIDHGAEIRHCAFIRENAYIGKNAVVGNSVEVKNALILDYAQVPHFNYVGDSIIGCHAHMGAGAVTSNFKSDASPVVIRAEGVEIATGIQKVGAMLGDGAEVGCNSVLNPGTVIGREARVYPGSVVRGYVPEKHIYKDSHHVVPIVAAQKNE